MSVLTSKRRAAPSLLVPLGGRPPHGGGLGVLRARLLGLAVVFSLGTAAGLPSDTISESEVKARFSFASVTLDHNFGLPLRHTREVHADLRRIEPWIASVGAAAAIGDVDGNLRPDDVCHVDTRTNQVVVAPLLGDRYPAFRLLTPAGVEDARTIAPMGCLIADLNEDGLADFLVYYWGRPPVAFMRIDRGPATLAEAPSGAAYVAVAIAGEQRWFSNAALLADVDGDGHLDLVIGNYFCDDGRILDARTSEPACPHPVMQDSMSRAFNGGTNRILLWKSADGGTRPSVSYAEAPGPFAADVANAWTLAIGAQDFNGDGLPDLYFANDFGPDRFLVNCSRAVESFGRSRKELGCFPLEGPVSFRMMEGQRTLSKPRSKVIGQDSFKGMGVEFADVNGDGLPDIYVSNITEKWALQESQFLFTSDGRKIDAALVRQGIAPYSDESEKYGLSRSGWGWDAKLADFDNDGRLEALQAVGFVRGRNADAGLVWRKSCWAMLQELATANDLLLKYSNAWFRMEHDGSGPGCDLSGNSRRNPFFVLRPNGRYVDASPWLGHLVHGAPAPTRGLAIGDADLDGRLDYIEARQYAAPEFHHNSSPAAAKHAFIGLSPRFIVGDAAPEPRVMTMAAAAAAGLRSRPAIGAQVVVRLSDGRRFNLQVDGGNGHSGKRSPDIHVGLGQVSPGTTAEVLVSWSAGSAVLKSVQFAAVPVGQHLALLMQP